MIDLPRGNELAADEIAKRTFPVTRRGVDADAVRRYLEEIATQIRQMSATEADLRRRLQESEKQAANPAMNDTALAAAVGSETGRVLQVAHEAAHELVAKAEAQSAELLTKSESVFQEKANEARQHAEGIITTARDTAEVLVEKAKDQCRTMVAEATEARRRILADLAERRRTLHVQLEQMRAGKDALAQVVDGVVQTIGEMRDRIYGAEGEARSAADEAGYEASLVPREESGSPEFDVPYDDLVESISLALELNEPVPSGSLATGGDVEEVSEPIVVVESVISEIAEATPVAEIATEPVSEDEVEREVTEDAPAGGRVDELFAKIRADQVAPVVEPATPEVTADPEAVEVSADEAVAAVEESAVLAEGVVVEVVTEDVSAEDVSAEDKKADEPMSEDVVESANGEATLASASASEDDGADEVPSEAQLAEKQLLHRRDELVEPARLGLARTMKRALASEQNELLDAIRHLGPRDDPRTLLAGVAARDRIIAVSAPTLAEAFEAGAVFAVGSLEHRPVMTVPAKARATGNRARRAAEEIARAFADEIVSSVERRVLEGLDANDEEKNLSSLIGIAFREWKGTRVDAAVTGHVTRTFALGVLEIARAENVAVRWVVDDGDQPCPDCDDNGLSDPQPAGTSFPTGHTEPPLHPGCRCVLVPVLS